MSERILWSEALKRYAYYLGHEKLLQLVHDKGLKVYNSKGERIYSSVDVKWKMPTPPVISWGRISLDEDERLEFEQTAYVFELFTLLVFPEHGDFVVIRSDCVKSRNDCLAEEIFKNEDFHFPEILGSNFWGRILSASRNGLKLDSSMTQSASYYSRHHILKPLELMEDNSCNFTATAEIELSSDLYESPYTVPFRIRNMLSKGVRGCMIRFSFTELSCFPEIFPPDNERICENENDILEDSCPEGQEKQHLPSKIKIIKQRLSTTEKNKCHSNKVCSSPINDYYDAAEQGLIEFKTTHSMAMIYEIDGVYRAMPSLEEIFESMLLVDTSGDGLAPCELERCYIDAGLTTFTPGSYYYRLSEGAKKVFVFAPQFSPASNDSYYYDEREEERVKTTFFLEEDEFLSSLHDVEWTIVKVKDFFIKNLKQLHDRKNKKEQQKIELMLSVFQMKITFYEAAIKIWGDLSEKNENRGVADRRANFAKQFFLDEYKKKYGIDIPAPHGRVQWDQFRADDTEFYKGVARAHKLKIVDEGA